MVDWVVINIPWMPCWNIFDRWIKWISTWWSGCRSSGRSDRIHVGCSVGYPEGGKAENLAGGSLDIESVD